jgi:FixJ family two-component response regulator
MHTRSALTSPRKLVLVIDDDPAVLGSLKFSLEGDGFAVMVFHSGEELLDGQPLPEAACLVVDQRKSRHRDRRTARRLPGGGRLSVANLG